MPRAPYVARPPAPQRGPRRSPRRRRRVLAALLAVTLVLLALDLSGAAGASRVRAVGAAVFGPLQRLVGPDPASELARTRAERDRLVARVRELETTRREGAATARLLAAPTTAGARVLAARVVGVGDPGSVGPERLTLDAGARDGVAVDMPVVAAEGLVGRVVAVGPWTSDVLVVGAPELTVGVRLTGGAGDGALGVVSGAGGTSHRPGQVGISLVQQGTLTAGQRVETLGSVGSRPFPPGILVGTVVSTDPGRGRLTPSGALRPAVQPGHLSVVGVLLTSPRTTPRPAATGGAG